MRRVVFILALVGVLGSAGIAVPGHGTAEVWDPENQCELPWWCPWDTYLCWAWASCSWGNVFGQHGCAQCRAACDRAYWDNVANCGSNPWCQDLAAAEYEACIGNCLADFADC